jgi:adenylate kinase
MKKVHIILIQRGINPACLVTPMAEICDLDSIDIGNLFRALLTGEAEISAEARRYLDSGEVVPDNLITKVIEHKIIELDKSFQLIRYPRTISQYILLTELFEKYKLKIERIWFLKLRNIEQMIAYKKENLSDDPYVKKFGVNEEAYRKDYADSIQEFESLQHYVNDEKLIEFIEYDYPIEQSAEAIKKRLIMFRNT